MTKYHRVLGALWCAAAVLFVTPAIGARQAPAPAATASAPTVKDPMRFSAFAVSMQGGQAGDVEIAIERWTTDAERQSLLEVLGGASFKEGGQRKLLDALQKVKPRTGYIRTPNSIGWDLKFCRLNTLADGTRQIVIATDKPVSFLGAVGGDALDYPFSFVEMRMKADDKGEGRLLASTAIDVKNGQLQLENYAQEPVRLTTITEHKDKKKGTE